MAVPETPQFSLKEFAEGFKELLTQEALPDHSEIMKWVTDRLPETISDRELKSLKIAIKSGLLKFAEWEEVAANSFLGDLDKSHFKTMLEGEKHEDYGNNPPEAAMEKTVEVVEKATNQSVLMNGPRVISTRK